MHVLACILGIFFCNGVVLDAFQTIILPRRPSGRFRITRLFYIVTWGPLTAIAARVRDRRVREQIYSIYGPVSLILLLGLWAVILITGFALIYFAAGTPFHDAVLLTHATDLARLRDDLYVSGTTLFTLGMGDVIPLTHLARVVVVLESGTGLGFVALVIGYLPVIYQAFSRREVSVAMLDGRAGSPPTATELLRRHGFEGGQEELITLLEEWERWAAEILESHISYPILCYYRSQHDNQSWLSALVAILDACALLITTIDGPTTRQAQLTFAMARHALIDLGHVFHVEGKLAPESEITDERLPAEVFDRLCDALGEMQMRLCGDPATMRRLTAIRAMYEPHALALSNYLCMPLPLWIAEPKAGDAWKKVADLRMKQSTPTPIDPLNAQRHVSSNSTALNLHDEEHGF
ncbi:potassium channel family protein [Granulicella tundricola]|uniref:Potassium channel domain-containing protein n=1 Tax=Granulicella tundricola (strain ATCC BAA-1859 / DSM 23138 / MP5ACTX9) TaxID=1198114 RepID=E8X092_GRATM|nr:potassium channel family protein [Granulicella tundricola]ADW70073.1 hypothetical protein AciX9_3053 [Granulicella tundricola MP5ACTX9]